MGKAEETLTLEQYHLRYNVDPEDEPEPPEAASHVLAWFWQLSAARQPGFNGPAPISFSEIESWSRVTATAIRPIEAEMIAAMDKAYLSANAEVQRIARSEAKAHDGRSGS